MKWFKDDDANVGRWNWTVAVQEPADFWTHDDRRRDRTFARLPQQQRTHRAVRNPRSVQHSRLRVRAQTSSGRPAAQRSVSVEDVERGRRRLRPRRRCVHQQLILLVRPQKERWHHHVPGQATRKSICIMHHSLLFTFTLVLYIYANQRLAGVQIAF